MLVLSRKVGEKINIGDDVFVEVRKISGNRVTLAFKAPRTIRILRGELFEANRTNNESDPENDNSQEVSEQRKEHV